MIRLAFAVPRLRPDLPRGAETSARRLAGRLPRDAFDVAVLGWFLDHREQRPRIAKCGPVKIEERLSWPTVLSDFRQAVAPGVSPGTEGNRR